MSHLADSTGEKYGYAEVCLAVRLLDQMVCRLIGGGSL
jgi:hypothetical protein